jgi:hypothetical protein
MISKAVQNIYKLDNSNNNYNNTLLNNSMLKNITIDDRRGSTVSYDIYEELHRLYSKSYIITYCPYNLKHTLEKNHS